MDKKTFYITTTLPYVNSDPHIGFAMEIIQADIIARWKKLGGFDVFLNTGTDEHGIKIFNKAHEAKRDVKIYVDEYAEKFRNLKKALNLSDDTHFIRTTDLHHEKAAQEFWKICKKNGYIYKKAYKVKYCVGCELEKTDSELVDGKCPIHPNLTIEIIDEENYFFKFSEFQKPLLKFYKENPSFVIPGIRFNEIKAFVERGLEDFSISRLKSKMSWGVPVPDDADHVMYVWFDALVNYISTIGWPNDMRSFEKWWPVIQIGGKDQVRQQAAMWQAMLMAAGLPQSKQIIIHGFINSGGQKMSKSLGNTIDPYAIVAEYGTDALRYFLAREMSFFEDSDFSMERFKEAYNSGLANGLGNLVSRVMKMASANNISYYDPEEVAERKKLDEMLEGAEVNINPFPNAFYRDFDIHKVCDFIWEQIAEADVLIQKEQPFKTIKTDFEKGKKEITHLLYRLKNVADYLEPIMPSTAKTIQTLIKENKMPEKPLFARRD